MIPCRSIRRRAPLAGAALGLLSALWLGVAPAAALDAVVFEAPGAGDGLTQRLRRASLILEAESAGVTDPQELLAAAKAEYGRMVAVLFGAGHYGGVVNVRIDGREAATFDPLEIPRAIGTIAVTVDPGPVFAFSRAEVTPLAAGTELPDGFARGEVARSDLIRDAARAGVDGWRAAGHARAEPGDQRIVADHRSSELDASITMLPGPSVTFGRLLVRGHERMREERVRTIAGFPEGAPFDPEAIALAAQRLRRTGSFASVALSEADTLGPGNTLDVTATLVEAPLRRFGFGAELDTEDGVRLSGFWLHRNLLGGAERLRIEGEVGGIGSRISGVEFRLAARYSRPATFTPDTTLTLGATAETVRERTFSARRIGAEAGLAHVFSDRISGEAGIGYLLEETRDATGRRSRAALTLPAALRYDGRDDPQDATRGYFIEGRTVPFLGLQGAASGAQLELDARGYVSAGERVVLAARLQLGSVVGAALDDTPRQFLFLSGGGGTVRGQPFRSLGIERPVPGGGTVLVGGRSFAGLATEVRTGVTDTISVVGFVDAGIVGRDAWVGGGDWHAGAGLGIRYATGIGPIRADLGLPVGARRGTGLQLYVGLGQAF